MATHHAVGVTVLWLTAARLVWRMFAAPVSNIEASWWQRSLAQATHVALYGMMALQPVLGWLYLSARGRPLSYLGVTLPSLVGRDYDLAETVMSLHSALATLMLTMIGVHAAAALAHHWLLRDVTLLRMLRGRVAWREPATLGSLVPAWIIRRGQRGTSIEVENA